MAVAFVSGSNVGSDFANASPVVTKGTNIVDGDVIVLWFASDTTHARGASPTLNGFTDHGVQNDGGSDTSVSLLTKVASGEGASWTFTNLFAASESGRTGQGAFSGVDGSNRFSAGPSSGTGSGAGEQLSPSITPAVNDSMIVHVLGSDPAANPRTWTPDGSPAATEFFDSQNALLGQCFGQYHLQTTAAAIQLGATPNASEGSAMWVMALRPAAGGTAHEQPVDDTLALADAVAFERDIHPADTLALADTVAFGRDLNILGDAVSFSDQLAFERAISLAHAVGVADDIVASLGILRTVDDTVALADNAATETGKGVSIDDIVAVADQAPTFVHGFDVLIDDIVGLGDQQAFGYDLHLDDPLAVADAQAFQRDIHLADALALADNTVPELNPVVPEAGLNYRPNHPGRHER